MTRRIALALALFLFSTASFADWSLSPESKLSFVSVKANSIGETHTFSTMSGAVSADGEVELTIDLSSVETQIPIRNERMLEFLFEVAKYPKATISASIDAKKYKTMSTGEQAKMTLPLKVDLHGKTVSLKSDLIVVKLAKKQLLVISESPILLNTAAFEMVPGVDKLQALAGLPSISKIVPVSFSLFFDM